MTTNYLEALGPKLIDMGYNIIPIAHGKKYPAGISGWQDLKLGVDDLNKYIEEGYTGVGVLAASTPGCDLDIRDLDMTSFMVKFINTMVGKSPYRVGIKPKALLPFKVQNPFPKISSKIFIDHTGSKNQVEILGAGNQWVAYGIHPDTQAPYQWSGTGIEHLRREDLPTISRHDAIDIIKAFEDEAEARGWKQAGGGSEVGEVSGAGTGAGAEAAAIPLSSARVGLTREERRQYLSKVDPNSKDYDGWLSVGAACHHETDGSYAGFEDWVEWSERSHTHDEKCNGGTPMLTKYKSLGGNSGGRRPVTFRSIIKEANEETKKLGAEGVDGELGKFLRRFIYVASEDAVMDLESNADDILLPVKNFKNAYLPVTMTIQIPKPYKDDPENYVEKEVSVADQWLKHPDRKTARGCVYLPSLTPSKLTKVGGEYYVNTYTAPKFSPIPEELIEPLIKPFMDHMEYLFPVEAEREWFLNWMALNIQHPENRCKVTPLHVSLHEGTGRGWLVELMQKLLGAWNCETVSIEDLVSSQFNGYLAESLLVFVDEVYEQGSKGFKTMDKIRSILTENRLNINKKYGAMAKRTVHCNFFLATNHGDALHISETDRRINVFWCDSDPRDGVNGVDTEDYFDNLYQWAKGRMSGGHEEPSDGVRALYWWLRDRHIGDMGWQRSTHTAGRELMIEYSQSPVERLFHEVRESPKWPVMSVNSLLREMCELANQDEKMYLLSDGSRAQTVKLLQKFCVRLDRLRVGESGERIRPWLIKRTRELSEEEKEAVGDKKFPGIREMLEGQI